MGRTILKIPTPIGDRYLEFCSVMDAPCTYGMTRKEFYAYYQEEYGRKGMEELEARMKRVEASGTSSFPPEYLESELICNRAGKDATWLTVEQIADYYCVRQGKGEKPVGKKLHNE